jgi:hypothetical protein
MGVAWLNANFMLSFINKTNYLPIDLWLSLQSIHFMPFIITISFLHHLHHHIHPIIGPF